MTPDQLFPFPLDGVWIVTKPHDSPTDTFWAEHIAQMKDWQEILNSKSLYDQKLGDICFPTYSQPTTLGKLARAWRSPSCRSTCPHCNGDAYFIPDKFQDVVCEPSWEWTLPPNLRKWTDFYNLRERIRFGCSQCGETFYKDVSKEQYIGQHARFAGLLCEFDAEWAKSDKMHGFFINNFTLIMRNWEKILKYPLLFNIPIDFTGVADFGNSVFPLGVLVMAWKTIPDMVSECPRCHGPLYFLPWGYSDFVEREFTYHCTCCGETQRCCSKSEYKKLRLFHDRVQFWCNGDLWTPSNMTFRRAIELLKLSEIDKGDYCELWGQSEDTDTDFSNIEPIDVDHPW